MATRYVGPGGNDANDGLSWANRKLTLNSVEDSPVQAGDWIWVAPGVYRELLTCDVSGSAGSAITYAGDCTGENTDGVGGVVRITGSDNDTTIARANCITASSKNYRTFRGFHFDTISSHIVSCDSCTNWQLDQCTFWVRTANPTAGVQMSGAGQAACAVTRSVFYLALQSLGVAYTHTSTVNDAGHAVENCLFFGSRDSVGVRSTRVGGFAVRNCTSIGGGSLATVATALAAGQTGTVNNCIVCNGGTAIGATATGEIIENYNTLFNNSLDRSNTSTGANSNTYPPLLAMPLLHAGQVLPTPTWGTLSEWSQVKRIAGTSEATDDLFGRTRPATSSKKSWGAVQYQQPIRETTTTDASSAASLKLDDAGRVQFRVPVTAASTTISVKAYREADYAGTAPTMVIKQPGQADRTTTDAGAASAWNTLTDTFTPAAAPPYVVVELVSDNTATSGSYSAYFDTLSVS